MSTPPLNNPNNSRTSGSPASASNPVPIRTVSSAGPPPSLTPSVVGFVAPGMKVGGFVLKNKLGEGGMGVVYDAEDEMLKRRVALKLMNSQTAADDDFRARFLREGQAVAGLKSDHVVNVYAAGEHSGQLYLAMEYIDGPTLDAWLKGRKVNTEQVLWVARDLLAGLAAAHAKGLIHRDVKPGNMMLDEGTGRLKLLDFGLVRDVTPHADGQMPTATVGVQGTPTYMSPEQARGQKLNPATDLFSAGVVLYRMVTGKSPFTRDTMIDTMFAVCNERPEPLTGVPSALSRFVARLMAPEAKERPKDAGAALVELAKVEQALARTDSPTDSDFTTEEPEPRPKRTLLYAVLASVIVVLATTAGFLLTRGGKPKDEVVQNPPATQNHPEPQLQAPGTSSTPKPAGPPVTRPTVLPKKDTPPLTHAEVLKLIVADIDKNPGPKAKEGEPTRLYLFAPHLAPGSSLTQSERNAYRSALGLLSGNLRPGRDLLRPLDPERTVFAYEPSGEFRVPEGLLTNYPYGLTFEQPESLQRDDELVRSYTGPVAFVRADWFMRQTEKRLVRNKGIGAKNGPVPKIVSDWTTTWGAGAERPDTAADELGATVEQIQQTIRDKPQLASVFGLGPLAEGKSITRERWESNAAGVSPFQELARVLGVGTPVLTK